MDGFLCSAAATGAIAAVPAAALSGPATPRAHRCYVSRFTAPSTMVTSIRPLCAAKGLFIAAKACYRPPPTQKRAIESDGARIFAAGKALSLNAGPPFRAMRSWQWR
jgi:hypothetical protein